MTGVAPGDRTASAPDVARSSALPTASSAGAATSAAPAAPPSADTALSGAATPASGSSLASDAAAAAEVARDARFSGILPPVSAELNARRAGALATGNGGGDMPCGDALRLRWLLSSTTQGNVTMSSLAPYLGVSPARLTRWLEGEVSEEIGGAVAGFLDAYVSKARPASAAAVAEAAAARAAAARAAATAAAAAAAAAAKAEAGVEASGARAGVVSTPLASGSRAAPAVHIDPLVAATHQQCVLQAQQLIRKHQQERLHLQRALEQGARQSAAAATLATGDGAAATAGGATPADGNGAASVSSGAAAAVSAERAAYFEAQSAQLTRRQQAEINHMNQLHQQLRASLAAAAAARLRSAGLGHPAAPPTAANGNVPVAAPAPSLSSADAMAGSPAALAAARLVQQATAAARQPVPAAPADGDSRDGANHATSTSAALPSGAPTAVFPFPDLPPFPPPLMSAADFAAHGAKQDMQQRKIGAALNDLAANEQRLRADAAASPAAAVALEPTLARLAAQGAALRQQAAHVFTERTGVMQEQGRRLMLHREYQEAVAKASAAASGGPAHLGGTGDAATLPSLVGSPSASASGPRPFKRPAPVGGTAAKSKVARPNGPPGSSPSAVPRGSPTSSAARSSADGATAGVLSSDRPLAAPSPAKPPAGRPTADSGSSKKKKAKPPAGGSGGSGGGSSGSAKAELLPAMPAATAAAAAAAAAAATAIAAGRAPAPPSGSTASAASDASDDTALTSAASHRQRQLKRKRELEHARRQRKHREQVAAAEESARRAKAAADAAAAATEAQRVASADALAAAGKQRAAAAAAALVADAERLSALAARAAAAQAARAAAVTAGVQAGAGGGARGGVLRGAVAAPARGALTGPALQAGAVPLPLHPAAMRAATIIGTGRAVARKRPRSPPPPVFPGSVAPAYRPVVADPGPLVLPHRSAIHELDLTADRAFHAYVKAGWVGDEASMRAVSVPVPVRLLGPPPSARPGAASAAGRRVVLLETVLQWRVDETTESPETAATRLCAAYGLPLATAAPRLARQIRSCLLRLGVLTLPPPPTVGGAAARAFGGWASASGGGVPPAAGSPGGTRGGATPSAGGGGGGRGPPAVAPSTGRGQPASAPVAGARGRPAFRYGPAGAAEENLRHVHLRLDLTESSGEVRRLDEEFEWDLSAGAYNSPELFAAHLAADLLLSPAQVPRIAAAIRNQLLDHHQVAFLGAAGAGAGGGGRPSAAALANLLGGPAAVSATPPRVSRLPAGTPIVVPGLVPVPTRVPGAAAPADGVGVNPSGGGGVGGGAAAPQHAWRALRGIRHPSRRRPLPPALSVAPWPYGPWQRRLWWWPRRSGLGGLPGRAPQTEAP